MSYRVEKWKGETTPDVADLRKIMAAEGYSVLGWSDPPGAVYSEHEHGEAQSHWIVSGAMELTVKGFGKVVLDAGDRDFMPSGTVHSARVVGARSVFYLIRKR